MNDWYRVRYSDFVSNGGNYVIRLYSSSPIKFLTTLFPNHRWEVWKFKNVSTGFWENPKHQRIFLHSLASYMELEVGIEWYNVKGRNIAQGKFGYILVKKFNSSTREMVTKLLPEMEWLPWRFNISPVGFWYEKEKRDMFLKWLAEQMGWEKKEDWYSLSQNILRTHYGATLMVMFPSPAELVLELMPEYPWKIWKFEHLPKRLWENGQRHFLEWIRREVDVHVPLDLIKSEAVMTVMKQDFIWRWSFDPSQFFRWMLKCMPEITFEKIILDVGKENRLLAQSCLNAALVVLLEMGIGSVVLQ